MSIGSWSQLSPAWSSVGSVGGLSGTVARARPATPCSPTASRAVAAKTRSRASRAPKHQMASECSAESSTSQSPRTSLFLPLARLRWNELVVSVAMEPQSAKDAAKDVPWPRWEAGAADPSGHFAHRAAPEGPEDAVECLPRLRSLRTPWILPDTKVRGGSVCSWEVQVATEGLTGVAVGRAGEQRPPRSIYFCPRPPRRLQRRHPCRPPAWDIDDGGDCTTPGPPR